MDAWKVTEQEVREWLSALLGDGIRVVAPVDEDGLVLFRPVAEASEPSLSGAGNTRWSPKEHVLPRTETLFSYRLQGDDVELDGVPADGEPGQVLFGVRPCDAAGLTRLDDVFLGDVPDPLYAARRQRTVTVSLACAAAQPECFCTAVGGSPGGIEGSDLQLMPLPAPETWLLKALTPQGAELVANAADGWPPATAEERELAEAQVRDVEAAIARDPISPERAAALEAVFDHPLWEVLGERCLGCGICAHVCPSCSCFDIADEGSALCGSRCRMWDSCGFAQFTRHASGHNPRATQPARYRQRVMHKFAYFPAQHDGRLMCVGCGRCLKLCPVGIDIHAAVERAAAAGAGEEAAR